MMSYVQQGPAIMNAIVELLETGNAIRSNSQETKESVFRRLVLLASKAERGSDNGIVARALRLEHISTFRQWLALDLRSKHSDFEAYAANQGSSPLSTILDWLPPSHQAPLIPESALPVERELFRAELEILCLLFK